jgi:hypothetical protein
MPPEHEAPVRAFYDHEEEEPRGTGRRRAVADWGVSEDVFDRMPGPRFSRRGEAPREVTRRREPARGDEARDDRGGDARFARDEGARGRGEDAWDRGGDARFAREQDASGRGEDAWDRGGDARFARGGDAGFARDGDARFARDEDARGRGDEADRSDSARAAEAPRYVAREEVGEAPEQPKERVADDWFAEPAPVSRTIVIEREPSFATDYEPELDAPRITSEGRRTVVIGGHPDRLPARARTPRTAASRIGPKPDRIVAYAVALGFLLILIAILSSH